MLELPFSVDKTTYTTTFHPAKMNRHALRSAWSRAKPEIEHNCLPNRSYFRQFSTTPAQWEDAPSNSNFKPAPTFRQRAQQASNEVSSLAKGNRGGAANPRGNRFAGLARNNNNNAKTRW